MTYQFIHIEAYAREIKEGATGITMREIIAEADREPGNCPHIDKEKLANPALAPQRLYGLPLEKVEAEAHLWAENSKDGGNQRVRKNGNCLLAGVVSLPNSTAPDAWDKFKNDAIQWLKKEFGDTLRSVIEHKDEDHPHLHFYAVPKAGKAFGSIHKGIEARTKARQEKLKTSEQNLAYCEAMREWQDKFSRDVGQKHGLTRIGPGRRRLTRAQWQQEKTQAKALLQAKSRAKKVEKKAEKQAEEIVQQAEEKAQKTAGFGASLGGWVAGVAGGWHKPTKEAEEAAKAAAEELEAEREKHKKEVEELKKTSRYELAQSESARDDLKQTNVELRTALKSINEKYGGYIKEHEAKQAEVKAAEQRRQQQEREAKQAEENQQRSKGMDFER